MHGELDWVYIVPLRSNLYDGVLEYWVTVRERGERKETLTREERQQQKEKAFYASA